MFLGGIASRGRRRRALQCRLSFGRSCRLCIAAAALLPPPCCRAAHRHRPTAAALSPPPCCHAAHRHRPAAAASLPPPFCCAAAAVLPLMAAKKPPLSSCCSRAVATATFVFIDVFVATAAALLYCHRWMLSPHYCCHPAAIQPTAAAQPTAASQLPCCLPPPRQANTVLPLSLPCRRHGC